MLELYCGVGGAAAALGPGAAVVQAFDVSPLALGVYRTAFGHPADCVSLEFSSETRLAAARADLWWLSPPCQPFTRRGHGRDADDPRSRSLLSLLPKICALRPSLVALENVPEFAGSQTHGMLIGQLRGAGYRIRERVVCATELGVPMRRRRYYLLAAAAAVLEEKAPPKGPAGGSPRRLADYVDARFDEDPALAVAGDLVRAYRGALDVVDRDDAAACCACFTSAYGRSPVRSGSYLRLPGGGLRRFHPREILALLGFPPGYRLPASLDHRRAWRLVGNSLSVDVVRWWLSALPRQAPPRH